MLYNQDWERQSNPVSDTLLKAADLLEKHGHTKHIRRDGNGSMCLLGALDAAQGNEDNLLAFHQDTDITVKASEAVVTMLDPKEVEVLSQAYRSNDPRHIAAMWNNLDERTGQEVIDIMRKAANAAMKETADVV